MIFITNLIYVFLFNDASGKLKINYILVPEFFA